MKGFINRLKMFVWYILTEPIRIIKKAYYFTRKLLRSFDKTLTWAYICFGFFVMSIILNRKVYVPIFFIVLITLFLLWEWQDGRFINAYRLNQKIKLLNKRGKK